MELGTRRSRHCHTRGAAGHPGQQQRARRKLYLAATICLVFMVGEAVGEFWVQGPAGVVSLGCGQGAGRAPRRFSVDQSAQRDPQCSMG